MTVPVLRAVSPEATPEEVAAILAAVGALTARSVATDDDAAGDDAAGDDTLHEWVRSARLQSRRASLQRGPWRMSARIGRRAGG